MHVQIRAVDEKGGLFPPGQETELRSGDIPDSCLSFPGFGGDKPPFCGSPGNLLVLLLLVPFLLRQHLYRVQLLPGKLRVHAAKFSPDDRFKLDVLCVDLLL